MEEIISGNRSRILKIFLGFRYIHLLRVSVYGSISKYKLLFSI